MNEWEFHVPAQPRNGQAPALAWCGARIERMDWSFVDAAHAIRAVECNTFQQPCSACWAAMGEQTALEFALAEAQG